MGPQQHDAAIAVEEDPSEFYRRMEDEFDECGQTATLLKDKKLPVRIRSYWDR